MDKTCGTCRWFVKHEAGHVYGDCHRYPATFNFNANISDPSAWRSDRFQISVTRERNAVWPNLHQDEFCDETFEIEVSTMTHWRCQPKEPSHDHP